MSVETTHAGSCWLADNDRLVLLATTHTDSCYAAGTESLMLTATTHAGTCWQAGAEGLVWAAAMKENKQDRKEKKRLLLSASIS